MKEVVVLLAAASLACGIQYDGLRVKFGWSDALADAEYFFKIPRTSAELEEAGWKRTEPSVQQIPGLRLYCPKGRALCAYFDASGFIAGLLVALPVDQFDTIAFKPEMKLLRWRPRVERTDDEHPREFWAMPQFFVSEETLKAGAGPQIENGATLQDGAVWVIGNDGRLMRIPTTEAELNTTLFKKQNCIPNMGTHYYYNMTPEMKCENFLPWFALTTHGELIGTGFQVFGRLPDLPEWKWFERPPSPKTSAQIAVPNGPQCLYDWSRRHGILSIHIYYVDKPWHIRCKSGDSIKPAPPVERLMLNGHRYASSIMDEIRKLFRF